MRKGTTDQVLLVDAQIFQTGAWDRGMGVYSLSLLEAYAKRHDHFSITFILNKNLKLPDDRKAKLQSIFPGATFVHLDLPALPGDVQAAVREAKQTLNHYISKHLPDKQVQYLILSLFMFDYCAAFPDNVRKLLVFYDLIPLIRWEDFSNYFPAHLYFPHLRTVLEADMLFAISETTKQQLETELSLPAERVINLNGARIKRTANDTQAIALPERFVLMPSADLPHKNNVNAVKGFADFNREFGDIFTLVITSTFSEQTQQELAAYCEKLQFTGNVSEGTLAHLFKKCEAVMLVSHTEGLGLPLLEAAAYDKPIVCSTIPVFEEISSTGFYFCDPADSAAVGRALIGALSKENWSAKRDEYHRIAATYTWDASAETLAVELHGESKHLRTSARTDGELYNVLIPHPSAAHGDLGLRMQALAPAMAQQNVHFFVSGHGGLDTGKKPYFLEHVAKVSSVDDSSPKILDKGKTLYFIDETPASLEIVVRALAFPSTCYLTTDKLAPLFNNLVAEGYLDDDTAREWTARHGRWAMQKLLELAGNTIYKLADLQGYKQRNSQLLVEQIMSKA